LSSSTAPDALRAARNGDHGVLYVRHGKPKKAAPKRRSVLTVFDPRHARLRLAHAETTYAAAQSGPRSASCWSSSAVSPAVIEGTDWAASEHAYGAAEDTPFRLVQLLDEDPEVQAGALGMLDMSVLHQESLYGATAPVALYVAAVLNEPARRPATRTTPSWVTASGHCARPCCAAAREAGSANQGRSRSGGWSCWCREL
jgi:hypothetical protein